MGCFTGTLLRCLLIPASMVHCCRKCIAFHRFRSLLSLTHFYHVYLAQTASKLKSRYDSSKISIVIACRMRFPSVPWQYCVITLAQSTNMDIPLSDQHNHPETQPHTAATSLHSCASAMCTTDLMADRYQCRPRMKYR